MRNAWLLKRAAPWLGVVVAAWLAGCTPTLEAAPRVGLRLTHLNPSAPFSKPVHMTPIPDGSGEVAVVEQSGTVVRFSPRDPSSRRTLLDLRERVSTSGWEEGLLSVAFHPRFSSEKTLFAYYSASSPRRSVVARFRVGKDGMVERDAKGSARGEVVMEIGQPYGNHNGGQLAFGPDGYLYIGLGDGGSGGDPHGHGQNTTTLLGAILRIDIDRRENGRAYAIPPDNPFAGSRRQGGARPEIFAYGLRNPWRFSFDSKTGRLFAADVGQNAVEEVNIITRGGNYGWNIREGSRCFRPPVGCQQAGLIPPVTEYTHREGRSVTGGFVYRGRALPALQGRYVFGDYVSGTLWSIPADGPGNSRREVLFSTSLAISAFGLDADREMVVLDHSGGGLYRIDPERKGN